MTIYMREPSFKSVEFIVNYNNPATYEILQIECENVRILMMRPIKEISQWLDNIDDSPTDDQWLIDTTEKWCKDRAIYLALIEILDIADGNDKKKDRVLFPLFFRMHLPYHLTTMSVTIT